MKLISLKPLFLAPALAASLLLTSLFGEEATENKSFEYTQAMMKETKTVVFLLENYHFENKFIGQNEASQLLEDFMEDLDYNHVFFLQEDRDELIASHASTLEKSLRRGQIDAAYSIYARYEQRVLDRIHWVGNRLQNGEFDFTGESEYVIDREEFPWLENIGAADDLWEKRLQYEILFDLLNEEELEEAIDVVNRRYERLKKNLADLEGQDVQEIFLTTLTQTFDPHSTFFSADTLEDFSITMSLSLQGIGAILTQDEGYCTVRETIKGGPADLDGRLKPGDRIVEVSQSTEKGVDVIDMKLRKIVKMIRGEMGTTVYLTIIPDGEDPSTRVIIPIVRDEVKITASRATASLFNMQDEHGKDMPIGVINLPSFYGDLSINENSDPVSTTQDVRELIETLKKDNIQGLVLDLRENGGGLLSEAIDLTGLFIKTGPVVQVKSNKGFIRRDWDRNEAMDWDGPLVVLVSRYSASASEITAGALQYYKRALIVGDKSTHGKGTVQAVLEVERMAPPSYFNNQPTGAAKLTIQKFYLPNGKSTQNKGVISDITFPSINEFLPIGEADLPHAMPWDEIKPVKWIESFDEVTLSFNPVDESLIEFLKAESEARQGDLGEFAFLKESIEFFKKRQDKKSYSLNLEKRKLQKETDNVYRDELEARQDDLNNEFFPSTKITLDEVVEAPISEKQIETVIEAAPGEEIDAEEVADIPNLDIHLRESIRILNDWINLENPNSTDTASSEPRKTGKRG